MKRFRRCFQFPSETKIRLPRQGEKACAFSHGHVCFYEANFLYGLCLPIHPFIHELLDNFKIALKCLANDHECYVDLGVRS